MDRPADGEGVGAGRQSDRNGQDDRGEPDEPDEADCESFAAALHRADSRSGGRNLGVGAELLLPPLGLAPLDLGLRLRDVRRELGFLLAEPLLELGQHLLALLELVRADLDVCLEPGFAELELTFALVELLDPFALTVSSIALNR